MNSYLHSQLSVVPTGAFTFDVPAKVALKICTNVYSNDANDFENGVYPFEMIASSFRETAFGQILCVFRDTTAPDNSILVLRGCNSLSNLPSANFYTSLHEKEKVIPLLEVIDYAKELIEKYKVSMIMGYSTGGFLAELLLVI
jgi:hypothetical protein